MTSPIRSQPQHDMLTKAASDAAHAAARGITQEAARQLLADHERAGSPALPGRAATPKPPQSVRRGLGEKAWWK